MKNFVGLMTVLFFATLNDVSGAQEVNPMTEKCKTVHSKQVEHQTWTSDFEKIEANETMNKEVKYQSYITTMKAAHKRLDELDRVVNINRHKDILLEYETFFKDIDSGKLNRATIVRLYSKGITKLKNAIEDSLSMAPDLLNCQTAVPGLFPKAEE